MKDVTKRRKRHLPLRKMKHQLLGKKIGMAQVYDAENNLVPVTVVQAGPCPVTQVKTVDKDGYDAVQIAFGPQKESRMSAGEIGHMVLDVHGPKCTCGGRGCFEALASRSAIYRNLRQAVKDGEKTPGKVAIFATCYVNYNEPGIGHDLLKVLEHNEVPYVIVEKEQCCGMPKLELGDLESVDQSKQANIPVLAKYAKDGFAILSAVPSCTLMFKQEIPLMYPDEADVQLVKESMWDPFEYLMARKRDGLLKTEFPVSLGKVSYQVPCHGRVQNIGKKTEEMFKMIPDTQVHTHERCSGHAGTFGVKKGTHQQAMKIGKPLFKKMAEHSAGGAPDVITSDCPLGGHHIAQGFEVNKLGNPEMQHPLTLVRRAYGLE